MIYISIINLPQDMSVHLILSTKTEKNLLILKCNEDVLNSALITNVMFVILHKWCSATRLFPVRVIVSEKGLLYVLPYSYLVESSGHVAAYHLSL